MRLRPLRYLSGCLGVALGVAVPAAARGAPESVALGGLGGAHAPGADAPDGAAPEGVAPPIAADANPAEEDGADANPAEEDGADANPAEEDGADANPAEEDGTEEDALEITVEGRLPWRRRPAVALFDADAGAGTWTVSGGTLERTAGAGGDTIRALQALPGVQAATLRATALSLRAAAPDETLWTVDGLPLPAPRSAGVFLARLPAPLVDTITVHPLAPPSELPGEIGGVLEARLVDPSDAEIDGMAELGPGVLQAQVSAPLGRRDRGHAVLVGGRRSLLEPAIAVLRSTGRARDARLIVGDAWTRARFTPMPGHRLDLTGLVGLTVQEGRSLDPLLDGPRADRTLLGLALARYRGTVGEAARFEGQLGLTRERQMTVSAADDRREERRQRVAGRAHVDIDLSASQSLTIGGGYAAFQIGGEGTYLDPRTQPPFERLPWRRMDPPAIQSAAREQDLQWSGWVEHRGRFGPIDTRAGLRTDRLHGRWYPSPRVAVGWTGEGRTTRIAAAASLVTPALRDPRDLDVVRGLTPRVPPRAVQAGVTFAQGLRENLIVRLDPWIRSTGRLSVWDGPAERARPDGVELAVGVDGWAGGRVGETTTVAVSGSLVEARRGVGAPSGRVPWAPPWSVQALARSTRGVWEIGGRVRVRAGAEQVALDAVARDGEVVLVPDLDDRTRLGPQALLALRGGVTGALGRRATLTMFLDLAATVGPLARIPTGGVAEGDTLVEAPTRTTTRDWPAVPWLGARVRW